MQRLLLLFTLATMLLPSHAIEEPKQAAVPGGMRVRFVLPEGLATQGPPVLARYDSSIPPWFMRRNKFCLALQ